jgi:hypothetical protein
MTAISDIQSEIAALPPNLQAEVLDFVQFVKRRHGLPTMLAAVSSATESSDSALFQALDAAGFIGCIETDDQLSTTYKSRLDFSEKCGTQP